MIFSYIRNHSRRDSLTFESRGFPCNFKVVFLRDDSLSLFFVLFLWILPFSPCFPTDRPVFSRHEFSEGSTLVMRFFRFARKFPPRTRRKLACADWSKQPEFGCKSPIDWNHACTEVERTKQLLLHSFNWTILFMIIWVFVRKIIFALLLYTFKKERRKFCALCIIRIKSKRSSFSSRKTLCLFLSLLVQPRFGLPISMIEFSSTFIVEDIDEVCKHVCAE